MTNATQSRKFRTMLRFSVIKIVKMLLVFRKKCIELLEIGYPILNVTVPIQLIITAILNVTKPLLVTIKSS